MMESHNQIGGLRPGFCVTLQVWVSPSWMSPEETCYGNRSSRPSVHPHFQALSIPDGLDQVPLMERGRREVPHLNIDHQ